MASKSRANVDNVYRLGIERVSGFTELVGPVLVGVDCLIGDWGSEEEEEARSEIDGDGSRRVLDWEGEFGIGGERVGDCEFS